jgi:hypothetical protein
MVVHEPRKWLRNATGVSAGPVVAAMVAILAAETPALAQRAARLPNEDGGWMQWVVAAAIALVVCAAPFLNAKRSHLG